MIEHIVLFKWKADVQIEEVNELLHELSELKNKIPGIVSYKIGHNLSTRSQGYGAGITSTFIDQSSLDAYIPHPEHQKVYTKLIQKVDNLLVVDFQDIME